MIGRKMKETAESRQLARECVGHARASREAGDHAQCVVWLSRARKYRTWMQRPSVVAKYADMHRRAVNLAGTAVVPGGAMPVWIFTANGASLFGRGRDGVQLWHADALELREALRRR